MKTCYEWENFTLQPIDHLLYRNHNQVIISQSNWPNENTARFNLWFTDRLLKHTTKTVAIFRVRLKHSMYVTNCGQLKIIEPCTR